MNLDKIKQNTKEDLEFIETIIAEDSPIGRFSNYLLCTTRNPWSIFNGGYSQTDISFADFIKEIDHAFYDDGEITFYTENSINFILNC